MSWDISVILRSGLLLEIAEQEADDKGKEADDHDEHRQIEWVGSGQEAREWIVSPLDDTNLLFYV